MIVEDEAVGVPADCAEEACLHGWRPIGEIAVRLLSGLAGQLSERGVPRLSTTPPI